MQTNTHRFVFLRDAKVAQEQQGEGVFLALDHATVQETQQDGNQFSILGMDHFDSLLVDALVGR